MVAAVIGLGAAAGAPAPRVPPTPPDVAAKMSALFAKAPPAVREWVDVEARKLRPMPKVDLPMAAADARQRFASHLPPLTPGHADVLAAMALYQTAKDIESAIVMSPPDVLLLRQMMDKKKQLEAMISIVMRSSSDGGQAAIDALKAR